MKDELCKVCGCEIEENTKCDKCRLVVSTICKCCKKITEIQTHIH